MSANIDSMLYVGETPWHGLGTRYEVAPTCAAEVIEGAKLNWQVAAEKMKTDTHGIIPGYHTIYREDNHEILGVVNSHRPVLVQNDQTFNAVDHLIGKEMDVETAASLGIGETVFGCFKIHKEYKLLDDDVDHYFVIVNDHLKVDGKVTVLNTPVRVVCQNTLSEALSNNICKLRIPITDEASINSTLATNLLYSVDDAVNGLTKRAEDMFSKKIDTKYVDTVLDVIFPFQMVDGHPVMSKANERTSLMRDTFISQCMGADNLGNFRGTQWQVFNALTDFSQHFHKNADKAYDLKHRMKSIPGVVTMIEPSIVMKFLKIANKISV